ncbi:hypothetical protein [Nocardioides dongkuii]|uniref:hypothetical protein n=1 Tax=Nocardioides dongkuii TaxID=2760089 RepID=UPI0015FC2B4A|nr:hypothetical protein [Nocardioides dongkuii]
MQRDEDEDAVWRSIVDNYGERPALDGEAGAAAEPAAEPAAETAAEPVPDPESTPEPEPDWFSSTSVDPEDRFVPPPAPPLPRPTRDRLFAWLGVFGSPTVLLVCLVAGISLPRLIAYLLVASFVGGFLYLVWQMPRGPRDPWDDGAQV